MKLVTLDYQGHGIDYQDDGWFNATQAAAKFGKIPNDWLRLPTTIDYIAGLERKYGKFPHLKTKRGSTGGTWLHPRLAVYFARWLDTDFAIWCDEQINCLIHGKSDWRKLRHEAASTYKVMCAILDLSRAEEGKDTKFFHYANEALLVNLALTGKREPLDRDGLDTQSLDLLAKLEERNAVLLGRGMKTDQRKPLLKQYAMDWRMAHVGLIGAPSNQHAEA